MLSSSDIYALINYASFVEALFIGMSIGGLLLLRVTRPDMKRPIKVGSCFPNKNFTVNIVFNNVAWSLAMITKL